MSSSQKLLAGRGLRGGRLGRARRKAVVRVAEGHFAAGGPFRRAAIVPHEIGRVVGQNLPQPGQPFLLGAALETLEIAAGLEHRLLDQIRGVDLPPQPGFDLRPGDKAQVGAAQPKQPIAALGVSLPGGVDHGRKSNRLVGAHGGIVYHAKAGTHKTPSDCRTNKGDRSMFSAGVFPGRQDVLAEKWTSPQTLRLSDICRTAGDGANRHRASQCLTVAEGGGTLNYVRAVRLGIATQVAFHGSPLCNRRLPRSIPSGRRSRFVLKKWLSRSRTFDDCLRPMTFRTRMGNRIRSARCAEERKPAVRCYWLVLAAVALVWTLEARGQEGAPPPLPEGDTGIAAKYPGDVGIEKDSAVVFADDFENNLDKWDFHYGNVHLAHEPEHVHTGSGALELIKPPGVNGTSNRGLIRHLTPGHDVLFLRCYTKVDKDADLFNGHNGPAIFAKAPARPMRPRAFRPAGPTSSRPGSIAGGPTTRRRRPAI